ncbi:indolepyruvate ferredoxin oxidoreductase family protein [Benzoatithermus flavus]|uniref:Indolepyruvate ferredoxin oxidoreductase family protein n=1 Tax=Benzoatithermus flavus TaxID=3108223 RepID=A0ABU8XUQ5_9PROT
MLAAPTIDRHYTLDDRYRRTSGRIFLTGIQALVRLPLMQRRLDRLQGLNTAGFVTGYRGSPVAGLDEALVQAEKLLAEENVRFEPAINEALAATAILGTQQVESEPRRKVDGVFALWYGKGPGVDWAGDAIKHGHAYGSSPHGGVLVVAGDDHGAVSSTMSHQSDQAFVAWWMPVLNPAGIADYLDFGLWGWAASRFSGAWVGFKAISETVESAATVELSDRLPVFVTPTDFTPPPGGLHFRWVDPPSVAIEERLAAKLEAIRAFARANPLDRLVVPASSARLGIVTVGKAHGDAMEALRELGFAERDLAAMGVRILKVGLSFPLEGDGIRRFARGLREILVIEEKRPLVEGQIKDLLYGLPEADRPAVLGKRDREGRPLLPETGELRPHKLAPLLAERLEANVPGLDLGLRLKRIATPLAEAPLVRRTPYFCSGCPHNTSTRVPEGSRAFAGIGCHIMATWMPGRNTAGVTQMGGEGATWVGLAPFTDTPHAFQNLGDGTFFHSGQLAIRQAVAAGVSMTYKILFNDAVAMTGGQKMETKGLTVPQISRQVFDEGVRRIAVVTDEPEKYRGITGLAEGTTIHHRRELDAVQRELREYKGVSVLLYDQTCAAEKRRRRKRNEYPDPPKRAFINELVCEACGDCSKKSNCLSVVPLQTEFGTKRAIDQSSCNKDFSCIEGFCPSFVTVEGGRLRRPAGLAGSEVEAALAALPLPTLPAIRDTYEILVTGVGGTGVLTLGALLGMAAHLEGRNATVLDFTGLAQKGGAVLAHVRLAAPGTGLNQGRIEPGEADAVLACDLVVAVGSEALGTMRQGTTRVVANEHVLPTADLIRDPRARIDAGLLLRRLAQAVGQNRVESLDAHDLALAVTGDAIGANLLLMGYAWQKGLLPVSLEAITRAIELNGVAVEANRRAFAFGRLAAHDPDLVARLTGRVPRPEPDLETLVERRRAFLASYQNEAYAADYAAFVRRVAEAERALGASDRLPLAEAVARNLFKLMAYKDEYEVARLYTEGTFQRRIAETFEGDVRLRFHLAPPLLARRDPVTGEPRKSTFGPWMLRAMAVLARGKALRGTVLDPFGWTEERRLERRLRDEYRATIASLLPGLAPENHGVAVRIASLPDLVRGFGHVKRQSVERYESERAALLAEWHAPAPLPLAAE